MKFLSPEVALDLHKSTMRICMEYCVAWAAYCAPPAKVKGGVGILGFGGKFKVFLISGWGGGGVAL